MPRLLRSTGCTKQARKRPPSSRLAGNRESAADLDSPLFRCTEPGMEELRWREMADQPSLARLIHGNVSQERGEMRMDGERVGMTLTDQNFQTTVLESPQPVLVAFTAEGCGPWQLLAPEIAALAEVFEGQVTFATLDVEAQPQTPARYGIGTLPALLFFKDGQVVDQLIGVEDAADIAARLHTMTRNSQA